MASGPDTRPHDHGHDDPIQGHAPTPSHDTHDHDAHGHDGHDDHGHDPHGSGGDAWVLPPIVIGVIIAVIIVIVAGGTGAGVSPFG